MREKEVVIIAPNTPGSYKFGEKQRENLALGCLGASLSQHGISNSLIDARFDNLSPEEVADEIVRLSPSVVGLSFMEQEPAIWSQPLVKRIREGTSGTHVVAGSYFPTLDPDKCRDVLPQIDSIAQGEGEETIVELVLRISNGDDWKSTRGLIVNDNGILVPNPRRNLIANLDDLPEPTRYADARRLSKVSLEGSRGCFSKCTFCSINPHLNPEKSTWRGKSPQRIVAEMSHLRDIYPDIDQFRFVDADFIGLGKYDERLAEIAKGLIESGFSTSNAKIFIETQSRNVVSIPPQVWDLLHQAGLYQVFLGVETGSEKVKRCIAKSSSLEDDRKAIDYLKQFGINVAYGFIMLNPWTNMEDVLNNVKVLGSLGNAGLDKYFSELILTPGTRAFETISKENGIYIEKVEGVDHYLYPLPDSLENIRRVGHYMLEHPEYRTFLTDIASFYTFLGELSIQGDNPSLADLRTQLDQLNLDIFLKIANISQDSAGVLDNDTISSLLGQLMEKYKPRLSILRNSVNS